MTSCAHSVHGICRSHGSLIDCPEEASRSDIEVNLDERDISSPVANWRNIIRTAEQDTKLPEEVRMLIVFGGLPGVGKTTIARQLARHIGAVYARIDSIEQAIRDCQYSFAPGAPHDEAGYRVAYAIAEDNLRIGRTVVADSVNPLPITRDAWLQVGKNAQVETIEVEVICSDSLEHRSRVERRLPEIRGLRLPTWDEVTSREYHRWDREHIVIDTAGQSVDENVRLLREALSSVTTRTSTSLE